MKNPADIRDACIDCGHAAMKRANIALDSIPAVLTLREGQCDACGVTKSICGVRSFGYPFTKLALDVAHWT